jgi:DNA-binding Lrp family transcriptional regulator
MESSFSANELDATDWRLLAELQRDASLSNPDLAARAHVSPATCLRRVRRLTEQGVIERRVALLSPDKLGIALTAIAEVSLDRQGAEHLAAFEARALAEAAVQLC